MTREPGRVGGTWVRPREARAAPPAPGQGPPRRPRRGRRRWKGRRLRRLLTTPERVRSTAGLPPRAVSGPRGARPARSMGKPREQPALPSWALPRRARARSRRAQAAPMGAAVGARRRPELATTGRQLEAEPPPDSPQVVRELPSRSSRPTALGVQAPRLPAGPTMELLGADSTTARRAPRRWPDHPRPEQVRQGLPRNRRAGPVRPTEPEGRPALPRREPGRPPGGSPAIPMSGRRPGRPQAASLPRSARPPADLAVRANPQARGARPKRARSRRARPRVRRVGPFRRRSRAGAAFPLPSRARAA